MAKSNRTADSAKASTPRTPQATKFPLFLHRSGQWCKKVKGKHCYFGTDKDEALKEWLRVKDDLLAGREPEPEDEQHELSLKDLCNHFLTYKERRIHIKKLTRRSWMDLKRTCTKICDILDPIVNPEAPKGKQYRKGLEVSTLKPDDFAELHAQLAEGKSPVTLRGEITRARMLFRFAFEFDLIDRPLKYERWLERPAKADLREARHEQRRKNGPMFFQPAEIHAILDCAGPTMRAMTYLAVNCGLNNSEIGQLRWHHLDMEGGWYNLLRLKTKVKRRAKLWQSTLSAIKVAQQTRPRPQRGCDDLVFLTNSGASWFNDSPSNPLSKEFRKVQQAAGIYRPGRGFAALRHVFQTVAEETKDVICVRLAMGHADPGIAELYREADALPSTDLRLIAIADHVHSWLTAKPR